MAKLAYVDDSEPGISRRRRGKHWAYFDAAGSRITDRAEIDRLNRIALPPAYTDAWYSPRANAHLLATGIDARGRKQYRYHPDWQAERDSRKFDGCAAFGRALPKVRAEVAQELGRRKLTRERAIASVVRLLDTGCIRIGNEGYARTNKSFGATTLRRRHAKLDHGRLKLRFRAKSGKLCEIRVQDRGLIRFVKQMQDLPGQHLFQYVAEDGTVSHIGSSDVNAYIHSAMGEAFSAKHFRTWRASVLAFQWLCDSKETSLAAMLDHVATELNNTPAIARKSYVHPALLAEAKQRPQAFREEVHLPRRTKWLDRHERGLIAFLERQDRRT